MTWNKVGKAINNLLKDGEYVPDAFFSFYGVIRDVLKDSEKDSRVSHLLALAEDLLNDVSIPEDGKSEVVTNHIEQKTKRPTGTLKGPEVY